MMSSSLNMVSGRVVDHWNGWMSYVFNMMGYYRVVVSWVATVRLMYYRVMFFWNDRMVGRKSVMLGMRMGIMDRYCNMMFRMRMNRSCFMMIVRVMMDSSCGMMSSMGRLV